MIGLILDNTINPQQQQQSNKKRERERERENKETKKEKATIYNIYNFMSYTHHHLIVVAQDLIMIWHQ